MALIPKIKNNRLLLLTIICLIATAVGFWFFRGIEPTQIEAWLEKAGIWAPLVYITVYVIATVFILPSTALNLTGGALFGSLLGTLWTSIAAIIAAIVSFSFTRTIGRELVEKRLSGGLKAMDAELSQGGWMYMFAIRLLPIIPYGLVNFTAGLTSVSFRDYMLGTVLGTVPGVLPFVMLGSSGLQAFKTGDILPLMFAVGLIGSLVAGATWYRRRRSFKVEKLKEAQRYNQQE